MGRPLLKTLLGLSAVLCMASSAFAQGAGAKEGRMPGVYKVLFIGDSITLHAPSEKNKWTLSCGMAASAPDKDYVHRFCARLEAAPGSGKVEMRVMANGGGSVRNYSGRTKEYADFRPDLVVVQFGENERKERTLEAFATEYAALLKDVKSLPKEPRIICVGVWSPGDDKSGVYSGWAAEIEATQERVAKEYGAAFAPVREYARNPECRGAGETSGVRWHPNDKGMQGYADSIFKAWSSR